MIQGQNLALTDLFVPSLLESRVGQGVGPETRRKGESTARSRTSSPPTAFERRGNNVTGVTDLRIENGSHQGQVLVLTFSRGGEGARPETRRVRPFLDHRPHASCTGYMVSDFGFQVSGFGFGVWGFGYGAWGLGLGVRG